MTLTFEQWKARLDAVLESLCGLSADDLPDWPHHDAYDEGVSYKNAAARVLRSAQHY